MDEGAVPDAADVEDSTEPMLVRPYVAEYECPDTTDRVGPVPVLRLAPRRRLIRVPAVVVSHRGSGAGGRGVRRTRRRGRLTGIALITGAAAVIATSVVLANLGGSPADSASPNSGKAPAADGSKQPGAATQAGQSTGSSQPRPNGSNGPDTAGDTAPAGPYLPGPASDPTGIVNPGTLPGLPLPPAVPGSLGPSGGGLPATLPVSSSPPAMVAIGQITDLAGLCLEATSNGGDRVRLWDCDGSTGQTWTIATDGTVQALGLCMQPGSGLVRLQQCDGGPAQQWRSGPARSLVNPASASCLGDPRADTSRGTPQRTAPCDQSRPQQWVLPAA